MPENEESSESFRLLVESIEDQAIYMLDWQGLVTSWNRGAELNTGFARQEILGQHFSTLFLPEDASAGVPRRQLTAAARAGRCAGEGWRLKKNGDRFWAAFVLTTRRGADGKLAGFAEVVRDITKQKRRGDALRAREKAQEEDSRRLHAAAESSVDAFFICEAVYAPDGEIEDFVFTFLNSRVQSVIPFSSYVAPGQKLCEVMPMHRRSNLFQQYKQVFLSGQPLVQDIPLHEDRLQGSWVRIKAVRCRDGVAVTASNITEWKQAEERLRHLAHHDTLTGLPNRSLLSERIRAGIEHADWGGSRMAVLMVDLDKFKQINDTMGHAVGDCVLRCVANRLKAAVRAYDSVIRYGGDEFVIVMPKMEQISNAQACAQRIIESVGSPLQIGEDTLHISCSVGSVIYPDNATSIEELLGCADINMYADKNGSVAFTFRS
jgi:diguanylate cyclase (GGDEF)-like protein/PAS domain S-box-containing protein